MWSVELGRCGGGTTAAEELGARRRGTGGLIVELRLTWPTPIAVTHRGLLVQAIDACHAVATGARQLGEGFARRMCHGGVERHRARGLGCQQPHYTTSGAALQVRISRRWCLSMRGVALRPANGMVFFPGSSVRPADTTQPKTRDATTSSDGSSSDVSELLSRDHPKCSVSPRDVGTCRGWAHTGWSAPRRRPAAGPPRGLRVVGLTAGLVETPPSGQGR